MSFAALYLWTAAQIQDGALRYAGNEQAGRTVLTWEQVAVAVAILTAFTGMLALVLASGYRFRREFAEKIDKLDDSIGDLTRTLTELRIATVSRGELDDIEHRLHETEMRNVRIETNVTTLAGRLERLEA